MEALEVTAFETELRYSKTIPGTYGARRRTRGPLVSHPEIAREGASPRVQ